MKVLRYCKKTEKKNDSLNNESMKYIESLSFNEAIGFLVTHNKWLKTPIIFDDKNQLIGYKAEDIRRFIPNEQRKQIQLVMSLQG